MKSSPTRHRSAKRFALHSTIAWPVLVAFPMLCMTALAGGVPTGAVVSAGKVTITTPSSGSLVINQTSQRGIVKWSDFSIGQGKQVTFVQPDAGSATLNVVTGPNASTLYGTLKSNGSLFLVNPNGITIGPNGLIDTGAGFIASTLAIADADFMNGNLRFNGQGGAVLNQGTISAARGGSVLLLGGTVSNEGVINAPLGKVGLGAGASATLDLHGDGFLQVMLPSGATTADGQALVTNAGTIAAEGGTVMLKASTVASAMRNAINMPGTIQASSVSGHDGDIVLEGGTSGAVTVSGALDASATAGAVEGGRIDVSGTTVALQGATVTATGVDRGGEVRIGGAFQGGKVQDPTAARTELYIGRFGPATALQNAAQTLIDANSSIDVSATGAKGVGGTTVIWSDDKTTMLGKLNATGAASGGAVEISSASQIQSLDLSRIHAGRGGSLLLDPQNITIDDNEATGTVGNLVYADGAGTTSLIASSDIVALLSAGTSLSLQASNDINWTTTSSVVAPAAGQTAGNLTLSAGRSITLSGAFTTGGGQWSMTANDVHANGVVDADRLAGAANVDLSQAVFSGNNGLLTLHMDDGSGNTNQDAGSLRLGAYSGAGLTATVIESAYDYTSNRGSGIVLSGDLTTTGDIHLAGNLLFNGGDGTLAAGGHINWDSGSIRGEGLVQWYEGGVLTHYGRLSGGDAVRMDLGQANPPALSRQYGDASVAGFVLANQLHVDANSAVQPSDALSAILGSGSLTVQAPGIYTPVGTSSISFGASSTFTINTGLGSGYFFNLVAPPAAPVTITPRIISAAQVFGANANYTYGSPEQLYQLAPGNGTSILAGDVVLPVATVNGTTGVTLTGSALSPHQGVGTTSVVLTGLSGASASNYQLASGSVNLAVTAVITPKPLDYVNGSLSETYGTAVLSGPALIGVVPGDDVAGINQVTTITAGTAGGSGAVPVGVYQVGYSGLTGSTAPNYVLQYTRTNTITVTPLALTVQTSAAANTIYGTQAVLSAALNGVLQGDAVGVNTQTGLIDAGGNPVALGATTPAGTYTIGATTSGLTGPGASNYTIANGGNTFGSLVVAPKALTWHVNGTSLAYGDTVAESSSNAFLFGLVPGDTLSTTVAVEDGNGVVPTRPNAGTVLNSVVTSLVGTGAGNYTLATSGNVAGLVTVVPRPVSYQIADRSSVYGSAAPASGVILTNVLSGDTVGYTEQVVTPFGASANYDPRTPVGRYADTLLSIDGNSNYVLNGGGNVPGTVTVTPKPLTYVVPNTLSTYGNQAGFVGGALAGVLSGDDVSTGVSVLASSGQTDTTHLNAGTYPTKPVNLSGSSAANYTLTDAGSTDGTLTILPRTLTYAITPMQNGAPFIGGVYGAISSAQPTVSSTLSGLVNGDTPSLTVAGSTLPTSSSGNLAAGTYTWSASGLAGASAGNYTLSGTSASVTIARAAVDVTLSTFVPGASGVAYYGNGSQFSVNANFGAGQVKAGDSVYAVGGFDLAGVAVTGLPDRVQPGSYGLALMTGSVQGFDVADYLFHVVATPLTVQPRPVSIIVPDKTQTYGDAYLLPVAGAAGVLSGDNVFVATSLQSGAPDAVNHLAAGTYTVDTSDLRGLQAADYQIVAGGGNTGLPVGNTTSTYTVNPKLVTVSVDKLSLTYGDASPAISVTGILPNDLGTSIVADVAQPLVVHGVNAPVVPTSQLAYTGIPPLLNAGTYALDLGLVGSASPNYVISTSSLGTITVAQKTVTASLGAVSTSYGTFSQPVTLTGFIGSESFAPTLAATDTRGATLTYNAQTDVGTYTNHVTGLQSVASGGDLNYVYVDTPAATAPLVITPKVLAYSAPTAAVAAIYGDAPVLGTLGGVLFNDDATVQVAGGTGMPSGAAIVDGTGNGTQYYGARLDVGNYTWSVTGLAGAKAKDYTLGNLGAGTIAVSQRDVLYNVDAAGAQHGNYQIPADSTQNAWTPGASLGTARFTNVMSGDNLTGAVALLSLNGNPVALDASLAVGQYFEVVTGLTGPAAKNYKIAATGSQPGIFTVIPELVAYTTTSGFYLPGTGYVGTPGTPTLYGPGGAFSDPNLQPIVNVFDSSGNALTNLSGLSNGRYYFKVVGFSGADAGDFQPMTKSYSGPYAQIDVGTLDIFANENFGLSFPIAQQQPPVLPALPAPAPAVQAPPLSGYVSSSSSLDAFTFAQDQGTGTATNTSVTSSGAGASAAAQVSNTQTTTIDGVDISLDTSATVTALAKFGVNGVTLAVGADAHVDIKMTTGPGYVEFGAQADADAKLSADRNGLQVGAAVIVQATTQGGASGSIGAAGNGSIDATASTFMYARTDLAATYKDGTVTTTESAQYGTGVSVGTNLGLSGSVGSVDAGITAYSPGSVGVQFNYSAGYSDGTLSVSMGYGMEMLFGGLGGTLTFSLNVGSEVTAVTNAVDAVGNAVEGFLHLGSSPPPPPSPDLLTQTAASLANDPAGRYAFLVAHPDWKNSTDPNEVAARASNQLFLEQYQYLVTIMNQVVLAEAQQQAQVAALIDKGDVAGAVALVHSQDFTNRGFALEHMVTSLAKDMDVHLTVSNGEMALVDN